MSVLAFAFIGIFLMPLLSHAVWWQLQAHPRSWVDADWSSSGILPPAASKPAAVIHVMAARTGGWKGVFAHHTWLVLKEKGARSYTRFDVVGWGNALRVNGYPADGRWYGNDPVILLTLSGSDAERTIPRVRRAVDAYPYGGRGSYAVWPGPNSNTFVASVAKHVPELSPALLPTAVGKDFPGWSLYLGTSPSGTGVQVSVAGLLGVTVGWIEGVEINVLGLIAGLDVRRPALKIPGWGRIGL